MSQVIQNLVLNADQAMPAGGTITITAENTVIGGGLNLPLEPGEYIRVSVIDHGEGIASNHLPRIFDPYFTTKEDGSGLGLATAYAIVKNHDGHITVDSSRGRDFLYRFRAGYPQPRPTLVLQILDKSYRVKVGSSYSTTRHQSGGWPAICWKSWGMNRNSSRMVYRR